MRIVCITHADFETPGIIEPWAKTKGYEFNICKPYLGEALPAVDTFDFLIIMGGPQSPLSMDKSPYLRDEIQLARTAFANQKRILGFCLGAQLIGEALGAKTQPSPEKEVGVYPITLTPDGIDDPLLQGFPQSFPVSHWHNDMPGLTDSATLLAYSQGCPRQIIRYQPLVYGFQCHLEFSLQNIEAIIHACPGDLTSSTYTQSKAALLAQDYDGINQRMVEILDRFVALKS